MRNIDDSRFVGDDHVYYLRRQIVISSAAADCDIVDDRGGGGEDTASLRYRTIAGCYLSQLILGDGGGGDIVVQYQRPILEDIGGSKQILFLNKNKFKLFIEQYDAAVSNVVYGAADGDWWRRVLLVLFRSHCVRRWWCVLRCLPLFAASRRIVVPPPATEI